MFSSIMLRMASDRLKGRSDDWCQRNSSSFGSQLFGIIRLMRISSSSVNLAGMYGPRFGNPFLV